MADPLRRMLVIVDAPHFYASLVIGRKTPMGAVLVLEAAPILRWTVGRPWIVTKAYLNVKGYSVTLRPDPAPRGSDPA